MDPPYGLGRVGPGAILESVIPLHFAAEKIQVGAEIAPGGPKMQENVEKQVENPKKAEIHDNCGQGNLGTPPFSGAVIAEKLPENTADTCPPPPGSMGHVVSQALP